MSVFGLGVYEQDPICQSKKGGLLNASPAGTHARRLVSVLETLGTAVDPVVSGSRIVSNFWVQR